jgi:hypothetical protein
VPIWPAPTSLTWSPALQVSLAACAIACPRDSDMQEVSLGAALPFDGGSAA